MATSISFRSGNKLQTIIFDAASSIRPSFQSELTVHPVEKGSDVTDGFRKEPDSVTLEALLTDYPLRVDGKGIGQEHEAGRANDILSLLLTLKDSCVKVKLETTMRNYSNMRIKSINPNTDRMVGAMRLTIAFVESNVVESETVNVVAKNRMSTGQSDKGKKEGKEASGKAKSSSFLHKAEHSDLAQHPIETLQKIFSGGGN